MIESRFCVKWSPSNRLKPVENFNQSCAAVKVVVYEPWLFGSGGHSQETPNIENYERWSQRFDCIIVSLNYVYLIYIYIS